MTYLSDAQRKSVADAPCPRCRVPAGTPCGGKDAPRPAPHPERVDFADRRRRERLKLKDWTG